MRAFSSGGYLLRNARFEVRLIYTGFLLLTLIGMLTMAAFQIWHIGLTPERIAAYYNGGDSGTEMSFGKTFRQLVETTHFHSFIMGVEYLVLAHLFIATTLATTTKRTLIVVGFAGLAGDLISPWLVHYVSGSFAYLQLLSWSAEWIGFGAYIAVPILEMWFRNDERIASIE
ncbi:MAG: hypothetical protein HY270_08655 [Deltaproteobacteria bacterium]|nr:hypothetical protein [Deltaproteobacteria bacterium]